MIKSEEYKNREVYTEWGVLKFDENGIAELEKKNSKADSKIATLFEFEIFEKESEEEELPTDAEESTEKDSEGEEEVTEKPEVKKAPAKKRTTRTAKTTKTEDKEESK